MSTGRRRGPSYHTTFCPHCGARCFVRSSREITPTVREIYFVCQGEPECGATFVGQLALTHGVSPSGTPNPRVTIPLRVRPKPANDDAPAGADAVQA